MTLSHDRLCAVCGGPMSHMRKDAKTCSGPCRAALSRKRWDLFLAILSAPNKRSVQTLLRMAGSTAEAHTEAEGRG